MTEDTPTLQLYQLLLRLYTDSVVSKEAHKQFEDTLMEFTLEVMKVTTATLMEELDIRDSEVRVVQITERQRHALLASGTLDLYIRGKDTVDD